MKRIVAFLHDIKTAYCKFMMDRYFDLAIEARSYGNDDKFNKLAAKSVKYYDKYADCILNAK